MTEQNIKMYINTYNIFNNNYILTGINLVQYLTIIF